MNNILYKKSVSTALNIIFVSLVLALAFVTTKAHAARPIIDKELLPAFLQGGPGGRTIAGPGFSIINAEEQGIIIVNSLPQAGACVTAINLAGEKIIDLVARVDDLAPMRLGSIGAGQSKTICLADISIYNALAFVSQSNGRTNGSALVLWRIDAAGVEQER